MEWEGNGKSHTLYLQGILFAESKNMIHRDAVLDICFPIKNSILVTFREMGGAPIWKSSGILIGKLNLTSTLDMA